MTSLQRKLQRKRLGPSLFNERRGERPQPYVAYPSGSYSVLHPTKGWRRFSYRRALAERIMAYQLSGGRTNV